jgi:hypothetical protein
MTAHRRSLGSGLIHSASLPVLQETDIDIWQLLGPWRAAMSVRPQQLATAAVQQWIWANVPLFGAHRVHAAGTCSMNSTDAAPLQNLCSAWWPPAPYCMEGCFGAYHDKILHVYSKPPLDKRAMHACRGEGRDWGRGCGDR